MSSALSRSQKRLFLIRTYGHLYFRHLDAGADNCFYCGEMRECLDHRPPITIFNSWSVKDLRKLKIPFVLLPCCHACNRALAARPLLTAIEALVHLKNRYELEYEKRATLWQSNEIKQMSPMFQQMIRRKSAVAKQLLVRVRFLQSREFDLNLIPVYYSEDESLE